MKHFCRRCKNNWDLELLSSDALCPICFEHKQKEMNMNEKDQETYEMLVELLNGQKALLLDVQKEIECDERELKDQETTVLNMRKMISELRRTRTKTKLMIEVLATAISNGR